MEEKKNSKANEKITKVKEDRDFLSRYLIARPRPSLVPELDRCIGEYEMSSVPRSLCETNGSLLIPTDKSKLMQTIEKYPVDPNQVNDNPPPDIKQVLIIDAMAVIHSLKKTPTTKTL